MEYNILGKTGIKVSKLCFGALTIGPLQKNLSISQGSYVMEAAVNKGVNFVDTADLYDTYPYIKQVLKRHNDLVIATKSYAYDNATAQQTLERALRGIDRDYVDLFLLHEQEGPLTLKGHRQALEYFMKKKDQGVINAVGISTHHIAAVEAAARMEEIDVIFPILNFKGLGIVDGSLAQMEDAIKKAYQNGKGIYVMKPLGGGHLIPQYRQAMDYILNFPYSHSIAMGMQRIEEVEANVSLFENKDIDPALEHSLSSYKRQLCIEDWCQGCGRCIERCPQHALRKGSNGKTVVDSSKCVLCGYCGSVCKELAIKVI